MRKFVLAFFFVAVLSCQKSDEPIVISDLNGYWEIEKASEPGKEDHLFKVNETFEHFAISGDSGVRSKVKPQFDGTFLSNDQHESFRISVDSGNTFLNYRTPYAKWQEKIIVLKDSVLVVRNAQKKEFHYKKTGPLNFTGNGKTTK